MAPSTPQPLLTQAPEPNLVPEGSASPSAGAGRMLRRTGSTGFGGEEGRRDSAVAGEGLGGGRRAHSEKDLLSFQRTPRYDWPVVTSTASGGLADHKENDKSRRRRWSKFTTDGGKGSPRSQQNIAATGRVPGVSTEDGFTDICLRLQQKLGSLRKDVTEEVVL